MANEKVCCNTLAWESSMSHHGKTMSCHSKKKLECGMIAMTCFSEVGWHWMGEKLVEGFANPILGLCMYHSHDFKFGALSNTICPHS